MIDGFWSCLLFLLSYHYVLYAYLDYKWYIRGQSSRILKVNSNWRHINKHLMNLTKIFTHKAADLLQQFTDPSDNLPQLQDALNSIHCG